MEKERAKGNASTVENKVITPETAKSRHQKEKQKEKMERVKVKVSAGRATGQGTFNEIAQSRRKEKERRTTARPREEKAGSMATKAVSDR